MKISGSLKEKLIQHIASSDLPFFSTEFFPPQTVEGIKNVISRIENVKEGNPMFCDITWHGTGNPEGKGNTSSLSIAEMALNICGLETMSHITCVSVNKQELDAYLKKLKQVG
ncbi:methylenetetrahydrofolate reductase-like protein, partial [Leptotrombidium deliense]